MKLAPVRLGVAQLALAACVLVLGGVSVLLAVTSPAEPSIHPVWTQPHGAALGSLRDPRPIALEDPRAEFLRAPAVAADVALVRSACATPEMSEASVFGSIRAADGSPIANARVALFARRGSDLVERPVCEARCDDAGNFCARPSQAGELALVAYAPGLRPQVRDLELTLASAIELDVIELTEDATIRGVVVCDGAPQTHVELVAILDSNGTTLSTSDATFRWTRGRAEWSYATVRNAPDGTYAIGGLRPGDYRVRIAAMRGAQAVFGYRTLESMEALAPAERVDFAFGSSTLDLRFECAGRPLSGVMVELESGGVQHARTTDEHGDCRLRTLPRLACNLIARKEGFRPRVIPLSTPRERETRREVFELEFEREPASLRVELLSPVDEVADSARFTFFAIGAAESEPMFRVQGLRDRAHEAARTDASSGVPESRGSSTFVVPTVPAGRYRVVIQAGPCLGRATGLVCTLFCDIELGLVIPATGQVRRTVDLVLRGSADVSVRGEQGELLPASFALESTRGRSVLTLSEADEDTRYDSCEGGALNAHAPTRIYAEECTGSFTLVVAHSGFRSRRVPLELHAGVVSPVDVTLERE